MNVTVRADSGASWYAAHAASAFERPRLTFDIDVDVCVIGGGLAGLTAAREVARRGWSVAVLEARHVGWSASGRNCGFVTPGFGNDVRHMVERVGLERARALWKLSEAGVDYVRATIRETEMPGPAPVAGWLDVSKMDNGDELLAVVTLLGQEFGTEIEGWSTERVRAALKSDLYFHAIHHPGAFHIDPLAYAYGLANAALAAGATIYEETPALAIDPTGVRKRVTTPSAKVRAAHVVLAGGAHVGALAPSLAETVLPVTGFVAVTAPLGERLAEAVAFPGAVSDSRRADFHYRIVDGDRLMWAGGGAWPSGPARAGERFKAGIARTFPQLGAVEIAHAWSGVMAFSVHGMPQIGEVISGLWLASGFGAHGLNTSAMAGEVIAAAITERDDRWRLFLPYELVWAGGRLGRVVHQVGAWSLRKTEEVAASLARRREAARLAEAQQAAAEPEPAEPAASESRTRGTPAREPAQPSVQQAGGGSGGTVQASALVPQVEALLHQAAQRAERRNREQARETMDDPEPSDPHGRAAPDGDVDDSASPDDSAVKK